MSFKKFSCCFWVIILLVACFFSLTGCKQQTNSESGSSDNLAMELVDYRVASIDDLFTYVKAKIDENYYGESSLELIWDILQKGIQDISGSDEMVTISEISVDVKEKIDAVDTLKVIGRLYGLQEAYEKGILTKKELQELATKNNYGFEKLELSEELSLEIRTSVAKKLEMDAWWDSLDAVQFSPEEIAIYRYYGKYGPSAYVVLFDYGQHPGVSSPAELNIDDVIFYFGQSRFTSQLVVYVK